MMPITRRLALSLAGSAALCGTATAQDFPIKPVKLVVPFPAGGSTDVAGRIIAAKLGERLGQQIVVENKPGASGAVGSDAVARTPADGYTLVVSNVGSQGIGPSLFQNITYDVMRDFTHVGMIGTFTNMLVVHPQFEARTLAELVALAKKSPGKVQFATSGNASSNHLLGEMLKLAAGIDLLHVPYRGSGPALNAVIANQIPTMFDAVPSAAAHVAAGSLRALAVASPERLPQFPDVPTFRELGYGDLVIRNWVGISGPAGIPAPVVARLSPALAEALSQPDTRKRLNDVGLDATVMTPEAFADFLRKDLVMWKTVVEQAKVKAE